MNGSQVTPEPTLPDQEQPAENAGPSTSSSPPSSKKAIVAVFMGIGFQAVNILVGMVAIHFSHRFWPEEGLAYFTQWRRFSMTLIGVLVLGHGIALTRALGSSFDDRTKQFDLTASSFFTVSIPLLLFGLWTLLFPASASRYVMGTETLSDISGAVGLSAIALGLGHIGSAYLRGTFQYISAYALTVMQVGALPCLLLPALRHVPIIKTIWTVSLLQLALGLAVPAYFIIRAVSNRRGLPVRELYGHSLRLTAFGVSRLPMLGMSFFMLNFGSWQIANAEEIGQLGLFNTILSVCRSSAIVSGALGFTILPIMAARMKTHKWEAVRRIISILVHATVASGLLLGSQLFFFGPSLIQIVLQRFDFAPISISLGLPFIMLTGFLVTDVLRNPLDAYSGIPYHVICYIIGTAAMGLLWYLGGLQQWDTLTRVGICYAGSFTIMGAVAALISAIIFKTRLIDARELAGLAITLGVAGLAYVEATTVGTNPYVNLGFLAFNFLLAAAMLRAIRVPWFMAILTRGRSLR